MAGFPCREVEPQSDHFIHRIRPASIDLNTSAVAGVLRCIVILNGLEIRFRGQGDIQSPDRIHET